VPKAGTTSLYKYLMQHPEVVAAEDKELTFWGNFFSPKRRPGREEVTTKYLTLFPKIEPGDFKVTGEAPNPNPNPSPNPNPNPNSIPNPIPNPNPNPNPNQGDGRGDAGLPVLLHVPDLHPQVHPQVQVPIHAALAAAARLLGIPQQGG